MKQMRILYFGMSGTLTRLPLAALLAADFDICGLVVPADRIPPFQLPSQGTSAAITVIHTPSRTRTLSLQDNQSPLTMAAHHQIPAFAVSDLLDPAVHFRLAALAPDLICVSCFPLKLPPAILSLPPQGCLNVHPSLLPKLRGPAPIFWTFRHGSNPTGVTIHFMDEGWDTGDIALQRPYTLPDGIPGPAATTVLAQVGAELLVESVTRLANGNLPRQQQLSKIATDPWPQDADFELPLTWSARHAFNFMRGTTTWGRPYYMTIDHNVLRLHTPLDFHLDQRQEQTIMRHSDHVSIQFSPGVLRVRSAIPWS